MLPLMKASRLILPSLLLVAACTGCEVNDFPVDVIRLGERIHFS